MAQLTIQYQGAFAVPSARRNVSEDLKAVTV